MSRLANTQSPERCYEILDQFRAKLEYFSSDAVFLYTNGLYFNSDEISFENRKKTNQQIFNHVSALRNLIAKGRAFIPNAVHYLPVDYVILNAPDFKAHYDTLKRKEVGDAGFRSALLSDMAGREYIEPNINFLLEEIVVAHTLRQNCVDLPRTLIRKEAWGLMAYPGEPLHSDIYQWKNDMLPKPEQKNPYAGAQYNLSVNHLVIFDEAAPA